MRSNFKTISVEINGQSHSPEITLKLSGLKKGAKIYFGEINKMLWRRKSNDNVWSTKRLEFDNPIYEGGFNCIDDNSAVLDGTPFCAKIVNTDVRPEDYGTTVPRPSHADYAAYCKDGKIASGGGRFSGRMTAPLCIAGAIAEQILKKYNITVCAYISKIGDVDTGSYLNSEFALRGFDLKREEYLKSSAFPILDGNKKELAEAEIIKAAEDGDSVGGIIECVVTGMSAGVGDALFEGLESSISYSVYAVPGVKGVEFGAGFEIAEQRGSKANDGLAVKDGKIVTLTNNSGGINGGISNGMPITLRVAVKPTPSIFHEQCSVDLQTMQNTILKIKGRHDACIVPRAVPCIESAVALALVDELYGIEKGL